MIEKLILGTAGLSGQPYGRSGRAVDLRDAICVLHKAYGLGIRQFDTSPAYGHAEQALGAAIKQWSEPVTVYSKSACRFDHIVASTTNLGTTPKILFHNWDGTRPPRWCVGVSTYSNKLRHRPPEGIVQIDWSILNQHEALNQPGRTYHCRSVFLQGVLSGGPIPTIKGQPAPNEHLLSGVERAKKFADALGISLKALALSAALEHPAFDGVVIGPQTEDEVTECVAIAKQQHGLHPTVSVLDLAKPELTDPRGWE